MARVYLKAAKAALVVAATLAAPALAQNVGDVGQDSGGNIFTYTRLADGTLQWMPGRLTEGSVARTITVERYTPTIWTDPDGCEHWVMDDGAEGFMTPHLLPNGRPVCNAPVAAGGNR